MQIFLKRAYEEAHKDDGYRVLVDRIWPRGVSKESAKIDLWAKEVTPSTELRKWFSHDPSKWDEFQKEYKKELDERTEDVEDFLKLLKEYKIVTFVYGAKDKKHTHALILKEYMDKKLNN